MNIFLQQIKTYFDIVHKLYCISSSQWFTPNVCLRVVLFYFLQCCIKVKVKIFALILVLWETIKISASISVSFWENILQFTQMKPYLYDGFLRIQKIQITASLTIHRCMQKYGGVLFANKLLKIAVILEGFYVAYFHLR